MVDRLEAMSLLLLAVEKGSFTAAAKAARTPLPTVSRKISDLEAQIGARLLVRTTRRLALTDAGQAYVTAAKRILEDVEVTERAAAGEFIAPKGELILTAPVLFGRLHLLPIVAEFLATYPEINVRLILSDRNLRLVDEHVDLAVRIGHLPDSQLVATRVGEVREVVCASPDLLETYGAPSVPADLSDMPCVAFDLEGPSTVWRFARGRSGAFVDAKIRTRLVVSTAEAAVWAAERGVGVTRVLSYQCADALRSGALVTVLQDFEPGPQPVNLLYAPSPLPPLKMRSFLDFAAPRLKERLKSI